MRYIPYTIILKTHSNVKEHSDSKMVHDTPLFLDTKFRIPTFKNVGDMHQTGSVMEGQSAYYMPPKFNLGA